MKRSPTTSFTRLALSLGIALAGAGLLTACNPSPDEVAPPTAAPEPVETVPPADNMTPPAPTPTDPAVPAPTDPNLPPPANPNAPPPTDTPPPTDQPAASNGG